MLKSLNKKWWFYSHAHSTFATSESEICRNHEIIFYWFIEWNVHANFDAVHFHLALLPCQSSSNHCEVHIDIIDQFTTELTYFKETNETRHNSINELKRLFRYPSAMVAFSSLFSSIYHKKVSIFCFVFSVLSIVYGVRYWSSFHCFWWCFVDGFP